VPFIAWHKGLIKGGMVSEQLGAFWDLYPTFLQLAKVPLRSTIDGQSLVPTFLTNKVQPRAYLYWELHEGGGKQAIRQGDWKAVKLGVSESDTTGIQLYNLKDDPFEKTNVAGSQPLIVKRMKILMQTAHVPNNEWPLLPVEKQKRAIQPTGTDK
jgi:arylsulfatase A-like enzyme